MKKALNLNITKHRHPDKPTACFCPEQNSNQAPNTFQVLSHTKIGEISLPPGVQNELMENTAKTMSLHAALLLRAEYLVLSLIGDFLPRPWERVGVRGQQAFAPRHLEQSEKSQKAPAKAFTLAEVLITLAIIGVVAAISIPSVISNAQQQEFKTGLRKAVSVLNSAITMNIALEGETPYDNQELFYYLQRYMSIIETTSAIVHKFAVMSSSKPNGTIMSNAAFYTTDGMRYEFIDNPWAAHFYDFPLYENSAQKACFGATYNGRHPEGACGGCGSYGLNNNSNNTTKTPCIVIVDVNGDRKPNPANINCSEYSCAKPYKISDLGGKKLTDIFPIMITDSKAIPYGVAAQKAMYQAQK